MTAEPTYTWTRIDDETITIAGYPIEIKMRPADADLRFALLFEGVKKGASNSLSTLKANGERIAKDTEEFRG